MDRQIIFDTETTGLSAADGDRIIEIGAIEMIDRFPTGKTFHHYLHPGDRPIHPDAEAVHGISLASLEGKPVFKDVLEEFDTFFGEGQLVAHNAPFDIGFLDAELSRLGRQPLDRMRMVDTAAIARQAFPGQRNSLDALCARFGISNAHRTLHGALLDAELLADVYLELTGGRQAGLALEPNRAGGGAGPGSAGQRAPQKQRANPLPSRITDAERSAHDGMIQSLGDQAVWLRYRT